MDREPVGDQFITSVQIRATRALTQIQWQQIHEAICRGMEKAILAHEILTDRIETIHSTSPFDRDGILKTILPR